MPEPATAPPPTQATPAAPPAAAPPAPAAAPPVKPEDRKEQLTQISDKLKSVFKDRLRGKDSTLKADDLKPEKKEEPKKEEPKKEEPKAAAPEPPKEAPKEAPKPTKVAPRRRTTAEDAATEAAKAAAEAAKAATELVKSQSRKPEGSNYEQLVERLPENYKSDLPVLERMEKQWPDKYKNLAKRYVEAAVRTEAYQRKWEAENPDRQFSPEDEEHDRFFTSNDVDWDERDFGRALARLEAEPLIEQERERAKKFESELRAREAARDAEPAIKKRMGDEAKALLTLVDKELMSMVDENGTIIESELGKLDEKHPVAADIVSRATRDLTRFVDQVERIFHPSGSFPFDEKNPEHIALAEYVLAKEQQIRSLPEEQQLASDGRRFATRREFAEMNRAEQANYWQLEAPDIAHIRRVEVAELAKKAITDGKKRLETVATRLGFVKPASEVAQNGGSPSTTPPATEKEKPSSLAATSAPKTETMNNGAPQGTSDWRSILKAKLRGNTVGK